MKTLLFTFLILIFALSCSSNKRDDKTKGVSDVSVNIPQPPGTQMTNEFKNIDTLINLSFFDLTPFAVNPPNANKKVLINHAFKSANIEHTTDYKLKDFYFIDLDNDNDLDLVYSSNIDQYNLMDTNFLLLFQNYNGVYKQYKIAGYLYQTDLAQNVGRQIILKTVTRPCCDYSNYNFFETAFNTKSWTFDTRHVLEIHNSKVHEE